MRKEYKNNFEQIYQAALKQNPSLLPKEKYCIDEFKQGTYGLSAAAQLASEGKKDAVKWLMQQGANINWVAMGAAMVGDQDWIKELMEQGADIQWVALGAAINGHLDFALNLIDKGASIHWVAWGAAHNGQKDFTLKLIEKGADINRAAWGAAQGGHRDFALELIKKGADINPTAKGAAQGGYQDFALELINEGADIETVACGAAQGGHQNFALKLIENEGDINTAAWDAAIGGHQNIASEFIEQGAYIHDVACCAASAGHRDFVLELIKSNAYINEIVIFAREGTPIAITFELNINEIARYAVENGHKALALNLIENGADITHVAKHATDTKRWAFALELIEKGANINKVLLAAALGGHRDFVFELIKKGADINQAARNAVEGKHWALALELIDMGANINEVAYDAAADWEWEFVFTLIKKGADISEIAEGAEENSDISSEDQQLWLLSHFTNSHHRFRFANALAGISNPIRIKPTIIRRSNRIARLMQVYGYDYSSALISTSTTEAAHHHGPLVTLAGLVGCQQSELQQLPFAYEMWLKIFESVFDSKISSEQFDQLGFLTIRLLLIHQLKHCESESETKDQLILLTLSKNNIDELAQWVSEQHKTLASRDKGKEKTEGIKMPSTLPEIFRLWHQRLGSPANTEEGASNQALKDCKSANAAA